jgi:hypothetical protein
MTKIYTKLNDNVVRVSETVSEDINLDQITAQLLDLETQKADYLSIVNAEVASFDRKIAELTSVISESKKVGVEITRAALEEAREEVME